MKVKLVKLRSPCLVILKWVTVERSNSPLIPLIDGLAEL
jgi:hypothetical protein